jgi:hypothetical protein
LRKKELVRKNKNAKAESARKIAKRDVESEQVIIFMAHAADFPDVQFLRY